MPKIVRPDGGRRLSVILSPAAWEAVNAEAGVRRIEGQSPLGGASMNAVIESAVLATYGTPRAPEAAP